MHGDTEKKIDKKSQCLGIWYVIIFEIANWKVQIGKCKLESANWKVQIEKCKLESANWKVQIENCKLKSAN